MLGVRCWVLGKSDITALPAVMRYALISGQDLIDSFLVDFTVPRSSGNRCMHPIPNSQFPIPNSQFPIPNSQFSIFNSQFSILNDNIIPQITGFWHGQS
ncbi:MAG: hypothetical protein F6K31_35695 [Symploca sp. SIO2G7]|nr:hypothetical protein [Symploca sp. SIO2G7]